MVGKPFFRKPTRGDFFRPCVSYALNASIQSDAAIDLFTRIRIYIRPFPPQQPLTRRPRRRCSERRPLDTGMCVRCVRRGSLLKWSTLRCAGSVYTHTLTHISKYIRRYINIRVLMYVHVIHLWSTTATTKDNKRIRL